MATASLSAAFAPAYRASALDAFDRDDASPQELLLAFASLRSEPAPRLPVPGRDAPASADWPTAVRGLYAAAGRTATPAQLLALESQSAQLDPRLQRALLPLLDAMAQAATLSLVALTEEPREALALRTTAALLVLDTVDHVRPQLAASGNEGSLPDCLGDPTPNSGLSVLDACDSPTRPASPVPPEAWPPIVVADPLGLVEIGTIGDDMHTTDRWLAIDPDGNDLWTNNAGAGEIFDGVTIVPPEAWHVVVRPVALAWDLQGNDAFNDTREGELALDPTQGSARLAVGILLDDGGDDTYWATKTGCQGSAELQSVAVFHDQAGNDFQWCRWDGQAYADAESIAVFLDDAGNDRRYVGVGQSYALRSDSYMRDADGVDSYRSSTTLFVLGVSGGGRAFFRDFGSDADTYRFVGSNNAAWGLSFPEPPLDSTHAAEGVDR